MSLNFDLFGDASLKLPLANAEVAYYENFIADDVAWGHYQALLEETKWRQERIQVYGKFHLTPRLTSWAGDAGTEYTCSNLTMQPEPWSSRLISLRDEVSSAVHTSFNSVLLNYYRDGKDSNGWHSDDEPELGEQPIIASLSLGAERDFKMRHKFDKDQKFSLSLANGSLLVMRGESQKFWQHQIPKRAHAQGRINLTFRLIKPKSFDE